MEMVIENKCGQIGGMPLPLVALNSQSHHPFSFRSVAPDTTTPWCKHRFIVLKFGYYRDIHIIRPAGKFKEKTVGFLGVSGFEIDD